MGESGGKYHEEQWTFLDGKRTIDYVMAWSEQSSRATSKGAVKMRETFEASLKKEGLELEYDYVPETKLHFVKIHAPLDVVQRYAEIIRFRVPLKDELNKTVDGLDPRHKTRTTYLDCCPCGCYKIEEGVFSNCVPELTATYARARDFLFDVEEKGFLTPAQRARVCQFIMFRAVYEEGGRRRSNTAEDVYRFGINRLIHDGVYSAAYPLHDDDFENPESLRYRFYYYWASFSNFYKKQPADHIRQYFGVRTAIYFVWLGFYVQMLFLPALFGLVCFIISLLLLPRAHELEEVCDGSVNDYVCPKCDEHCTFKRVSDWCFKLKLLYVFDNPTTVIFAMFMTLWAAFFLAMWKRYSAEITLRWDLTDLDDNDENPRPEYAAKLAKLAAQGNVSRQVNFITNATEPKVSFWKYMFPGKVLSYSTMLLMIAMAVAAIIGVTMYHMFMMHFLPVVSSPTATCLNLVTILIFSPIYKNVAVVLTDWEMPRTQKEFDGSLTVKMYVLEFINNYSSIFYIAFFKGKLIGPPSGYFRVFGVRQLECEIGGCMWQLTQQLAIIMIGKRIYRSISKLLKPCISTKYRRKVSHIEERDEEEINQWEKDYYLNEMKNPLLVNEYIDMVLQYGFVTIFVSAFPLAPLFAFLNNILEIRIDAQKYLVYHRRPTMRRTKDIGVWFNILTYVSNLAIFTNGFIIAFTSSVVPKLVYKFYVSEDFSTRGFMNNSLSYISIDDLDMQDKPKTSLKHCRYYDYREPPWSEDKYQETKMFWMVMAFRLIFFFLFEILVVLAVVLIKWLLGDTPPHVKWQVRRRHYLLNEMIINHELSLSGGTAGTRTVVTENKKKTSEA